MREWSSFCTPSNVCSLHYNLTQHNITQIQNKHHPYSTETNSTHSQAHLEEYMGMNLHHYTEVVPPTTVVATTTLITDMSRRKYSPDHTHAFTHACASDVGQSQLSAFHYNGVEDDACADYHGYFVVVQEHKVLADENVMLRGLGLVAEKLAGCEMTVAEYVVAALYALGVTRVFGYEGTSVVPIIDSIVLSKIQYHQIIFVCVPCMRVCACGMCVCVFVCGVCVSRVKMSIFVDT
jgi:hypothetical protein